MALTIKSAPKKAVEALINMTKKPAPTHSKEVTVLLGKVESLTEQINVLASDLEDEYQELAILTCPFHPGQKVMTDVGLGKVGLQVNAVVSPKNPAVGNLWELQTFAISKAGEVTQRTVCISEAQGKEQGLRVMP